MFYYVHLFIYLGRGWVHSQFSPSPTWVLGIELGSLGLAASVIILEHLAAPSTDLEGWTFSS